MFSKSVTIEKYDPELAAAMAAEVERQQDHVELIASENYAQAPYGSPGSAAHQKYAEGYPEAAITAAARSMSTWPAAGHRPREKLFGAEYANVQPHSGSQANQAVYASVLKPGDTILGMNSRPRRPPHPRRFCGEISGKLYNAVTYGLDENEALDYAESGAFGAGANPK